MIVVLIFVDPDPEKGGLYAVQYRENEDNCFDALLSDLGGHPTQDDTLPSPWLSQMINRHWDGIKLSGLQVLTKDQALEAIQEEAKALFRSLKELAKKGRHSSTANLEVVFSPLGTTTSHRIVDLAFEPIVFKSKTPRHRPTMIRLYALQIDRHPNLFLVVGGGIKSSQVAQLSYGLSLELQKANEVAQTLISNGVTYSWFDNQTFQLS